MSIILIYQSPLLNGSLNFHISEGTVFIESIHIYFPQAFTEGGVEGNVEKDKKDRIK